ncbi:MAG TPA: cytochrome bc complex cytochrome b subunit [Vicinamibacterales bacterium]|jgi:ubiquinol-cytochrome c reductase cytochrome b subunit
MIVRGLARWLDRRVRLAKFTRHALNHIFPDHWSFMLGEIALYSFVILVLTGTFLAMFFNASSAKEIYNGPYLGLDGVTMSAAYKSVLHISFEVPAGLLVRQMHHWAALIFLGAIVAHLARIFFTGAYRRPREINWVIGLTLFLLAITNGYLGYSIVGDLLSGTGLRIGYAILLSVPVIGKWLAYIALGGNIPADPTIPRLYGLHIFVVPALIAGLLALHLAIIWRQLHTNYPGPRRTNRTIVGSRLWPSYTARSIGLFLILFGVIAGLAALVQIDPIWAYGPYDPTAVLPGAQPDWYLGWIEGAMRLFPGVNLHLGPYLVPGLFFSGLLFPVLVFGGLYLYPFIEQFITVDEQDHNVLRMPWERPFATALGCSALMMMLVLLVAAGDDVVALALGASLQSIRILLRILFFAAPAATFLVIHWLCARRKRREHERARADEERSRAQVRTASSG